MGERESVGMPFAVEKRVEGGRGEFADEVLVQFTITGIQLRCLQEGRIDLWPLLGSYGVCHLFTLHSEGDRIRSSIGRR